jgi:hypothetical protein
VLTAYPPRVECMLQIGSKYDLDPSLFLRLIVRAKNVIRGEGALAVIERSTVCGRREKGFGTRMESAFAPFNMTTKGPSQ